MSLGIATYSIKSSLHVLIHTYMMVLLGVSVFFLSQSVSLGITS